jgi:TonB family protein
MTNVKKHERRQISLSMLAAFFAHCLVLIAFLRFIPAIMERADRYTGPITVTVEGLEAAAPGVAPSPAAGSPPAAVPSPAAGSPPKAEPAKPAGIALNAGAARSSAPDASSAEKTPAAPETAWVKPAPLRKEDDPAYGAVRDRKNLGKVPEARSDDVAAPNIVVPKAPASPAPQTGKEGGFKQETVVEEGPMLFDRNVLDKLGKSLGTSGADAGSAAGGPAKAQKGGDSGPAGSPDITWEIAGVQRKLRAKPPDLDSDIIRWVQKERLNLEVVVSFSVTAEGQTTPVTTAGLSGSSGYPDVDTAVLDAVRKMAFFPAPGAGPAKGTIRYIIRTK